MGSIIATDSASDEDADYNELFAKIQAAAGADLTAFNRAPNWSGESVELTLRRYGDENTPPFSISKLPLAVEVAPEVTVVAPPGTGKTTTLLQLAGEVLAANSIIPLYFGLGDWTAGSSTLLASVHQRSAIPHHCTAATPTSHRQRPRSAHSNSQRRLSPR